MLCQAMLWYEIIDFVGAWIVLVKTLTKHGWIFDSQSDLTQVMKWKTLFIYH